MIRTRNYRKRRSTGPVQYWGNQYIRIVGIILIIVTVASFYIYQRVWVRGLVDDIEQLEQQNDRAKEFLTDIKSDWMAASTITNIETRMGELRLGLKPTKPSQNYTLRPRQDQERSRYAGLMKAFEKLKGNIPLVSSNEADAGELFDGE